ncbi:MAG: YfiR family protein [Bacteroidetes bacterium]|nr:YfiR family protein [Bacteroidota bacterium]HET6244788.1 YfiR family protein [Bacteroidia bacterium]
MKKIGRYISSAVHVFKMRKVCQLIFCSCLFNSFLFILITGFAVKPQSEAEEYNLKAAFIYNFTMYIEWSGFIAEEEFIIGIIGNSQINEPLAQIARTKTVNGKKIIIQNFDNPEEIIFCHILFISRDTTFPLKTILARANFNGTLIVSEKRGFAEQGTAINFVIDNDKVKFEANTKAIRSAGLTASSQLLKLARIVE